jgi:hypothetical protein
MFVSFFKVLGVARDQCIEVVCKLMGLYPSLCIYRLKARRFKVLWRTCSTHGGNKERLACFG